MSKFACYLSQCLLMLESPIHAFEVILKYREGCGEPEECVAGHAEISRIDGSKIEQQKWALPLGLYAKVSLVKMYPTLRAAN